jgi:nucleotidyltransferase substrate binding protein (TIGR01987 family)
MLKRHLESDEGSDNVDHLHRKDLFRMAGEKGIIEDVSAWFTFHEARNQTSHTYNEAVAEEVYDKARMFLPHALRLLKELGKRKHA